jgi:glycosyltransferase involved in cell wall biosynthesis
MKISTAIKRFNKPQTHLIISGYPEKDGSGNSYGISWYTKETIEPLARKQNARFVVLAETNHNNDPKIYQNGKILVLRVFDQRHPSFFPRILTWLFRFNTIKKVYVHSEFAANGGIINSVLLIPFLFLIKITRRHITFFAHNVVETFDVIGPHLNLRRNSWNIRFFNLMLSIYNRALSFLVDRFVVLDTALLDRAKNFISQKKLVMQPIFVKKPKNKISKLRARKKLNINNDEFVLLYFGFITWYKGADWLIQKIQRINKSKNHKKIRLILAGGEAYSLREKEYYQKYYQKLLKKVKGDQNITITGFVSERKVGTYFSAADIVVYPYRGLIGASGALTYALSYGKPFLLSNKMSELLNAVDIQRVMGKNDLSKNDLLFSHQGKSFEKMLKKVQNTSIQNKLKSFSHRLACARSMEKQISSYYEKIFLAKGVFSFQEIVQNMYETFSSLSFKKT